MKRKSIAVIAAISMVVLSACGSNSSSQSNEKANISIWYVWSGPDAKFIKDAISRFEQVNPGIQVTESENTTVDKFLAAINSGKGPDISVDLGLDNVARFCNSGMWLDLRQYLGSNDGIDLSKVFPASVLKGTSYKGIPCSLPLLTDTFGLFYNKTLLTNAGFSSPPKTTDDLITYSKKITKFNSDGSIRVAGYVPWTGYYSVYWSSAYASYMFGAPWYSSDGKSMLGTDTRWEQALTWQKDFIATVYGHGDYTKGSKALAKFVAGAGDEWGCAQDLQAGRTAMILDGEWRIGSICPENKATKVSALNYGIAPMPVAPAMSSDYGFGPVGGPVMGITKSSKAPAAAWKLLKFLATDKTLMESGFKSLSQFPSTTASLDDISNGTSDSHWKEMTSIVGNKNSGWRSTSIIGNKDQSIADGVFSEVQMNQMPNVTTLGFNAALHAELLKLAHQIDQYTLQGKH